MSPAPSPARRRRALWFGLTVLALLAVGALVLWLNQNLVQRSEEISTDHGEAARNNPLYMADRLLVRLGRTVHSVRSLYDLPPELPPTGTVMLTIPSYVLGAAETARLLAWVQQGGHLLVQVQHEHELGQKGDYLLNALAVHSYRPEQCPPTEPTPVQIAPNAPSLQVQFQGGNLRLNGDYWQALPWGRGQVTLLADSRLFSNARLDDHDHAGFLWGLMQRNPTGPIWLQYRLQLPSLLELLWERAWLPLTGLLLTLLAAFWHYSRRLGPVLTAQIGPRRRLAEHLDASSRFLWRHGAGPTLLHAARQYAIRRLQRRLSPDAAEALLATVARNSDQPLTEAGLLRTLQALQRLQLHPLAPPTPSPHLSLSPSPSPPSPSTDRP